MSEKLGEAILELRTDDSQLIAGIDRAEGKAEGLAGEFRSAAASVNASTKSVGASAADMASRAQAAARAATGLTAGLRGSGTAGRNTSFAMQNLAFQMNDVVQGFAMGQRPMQIFAQQGFQIAQIMGQAGIGIGGLVKHVTMMGVRMALAHPILAMLAVGAGAAAIGFKVLQDQIADDAHLDRFAQKLGLTRQEMKKLGDVAITSGDLFEGLWRTIAQRTGVDKSIADFKSFMLKSFLDAVQGAADMFAALYGEIVGTYRAVSRIWGDLPAMFSATFARAVNAAAEKLESFINGVIGGINSLAREANALLGTNLFGQIGGVHLPRMEADFSKSFGNVRGIVRGEIEGATQEAKGAIAGFMSDVRKNTIDAAEDRLQARANSIIADRAGTRAKADRDVAKAMKERQKAAEQALQAARNYADGLILETDAVGKNAIEQKRMEVAIAAAAARKAAAVAPTEALRNALLAEADAIVKAGAAWERVTKDQTNADFIKNTVEPLEFETSLIGKSAAQQRMLRAERELTNAGIERGSPVWQRYLADVEKAIHAENTLGGAFLKTAQSAAESARGIAGSLKNHDFLGALQQAITMLGQVGTLLSGAGAGGAGGFLSGVSGFLGSIFGTGGGGFAGGFATGGLIPTGSWGIVGERGPEPVIGTSRGPMVLPTSTLREGSAGPSSVNVNFYGPVSNAAEVRRSAAQAGAVLARGVAAGQRGI